MTSKHNIWRDANGNQWEVRVRIKEANRLNEAAGIDLFDPEQLQEVIENPLQIVTMLAVIHEEQRKLDSISVEDFTDLVACGDGSSFRQAKHALAEGLAAFFDSLDKRSLGTLLRKAVAAENLIEQNALETVETQAEAVIQAAVSQAGRILDQAIATGKE
jgi:hypothetical protein